MKKEKQVKSYQRRTKSGKMVTVRAHTAKYEAADKSKEVAKKKGAGKELEERKKKPVQMEIPFGKEEEKKVLDEVKETAEKKTAKKVRPVGSGTNGPTPKEPKGKKYTVNGKDFYVRRTSGTAFSVVDADGKKAKASDRKAVMDMASDKTKKSVERQVAKNKKDRTRTKMESLGYAKPTEKYRESSGVPRTRKTSAKSSEPSFTAAEFKEWYRGTGSAADKKVAKALRAQLGRSGYRKLEDEAIDSYSSRGHLSMFKRVSGGDSKRSPIKDVNDVVLAHNKRVSKSAEAQRKSEEKNSKKKMSSWAKGVQNSAKNQMEESKKSLKDALSSGNSKKIRDSLSRYRQGMEDYTFGKSKAIKTAAEKEYNGILSSLNEAGYDNSGYKKRGASSKRTTGSSSKSNGGGIF